MEHSRLLFIIVMSLFFNLTTSNRLNASQYEDEIDQSSDIKIEANLPLFRSSSILAFYAVLLKARSVITPENSWEGVKDYNTYFSEEFSLIDDSWKFADIVQLFYKSAKLRQSYLYLAINRNYSPVELHKQIEQLKPRIEKLFFAKKEAKNTGLWSYFFGKTDPYEKWKKLVNDGLLALASLDNYSNDL